MEHRKQLIMNLSLTVILILFLTTEVSNQLLDVVNVKRIKAMGQFRITCDASRVQVSKEDENIQDLLGLVIHVNSLAHPNLRFVALYHPTFPEGQREVTVIPKGRDWVANFSGGYTPGNRNIMKVEILVRDARCEDTGRYTCNVQYNSISGDFVEVTGDMVVSSEAAATYPNVTLDPYNVVVNGVKNYSNYELGTNVTITCSFDGPPNMIITWRREVRPAVGAVIAYEEYTLDQSVTSESLSPNEVGPCIQSRYVARLRVEVSKNDMYRTYQCVAQSDGVDVVTSGAIITAGSIVPHVDSFNFYLLVAIIGCILIIIIFVMTILIVCMTRKKKRISVTREPSNTQIPSSIATEKSPNDKSAVSQHAGSLVDQEKAEEQHSLSSTTKQYM